MGAQYAIMRFAKYKGGAVGRIEAHNERTKKTYQSNPDIDLSRSDQNFHLIQSRQSYLAECNRQIAAARCRVRSDSVKMVEALFTASPEFFQGKNRKEIRTFFEEALTFFKSQQRGDTILSAVVHMDEKTPHMHLSFVPLTKDNRLSAKEILGNRKKLTQWQDLFWEHMVQKFPDLERGESASKTGRTHIPTRIYKEAEHLQDLQAQLEDLLSGSNALNLRHRKAEIEALLREYIPGVEKMRTRLKQYSDSCAELAREKDSLQQENDSMKRQHVRQEVALAKTRAELMTFQNTFEQIPREILDAYTKLRTQDQKRGKSD